MGLAACANDDFVDTNPTSNNSGAIGFGSNIEAVTRAALGKDDADKLGSTFYVFGIKNEGKLGAGQLEDKDLVFNNYKVVYTDGTDNTSTSNTTGWEYVGQTLTQNEQNNIKSNIGAAAQTPKYWDSNANDYTFYAFSASSSDLENGNVKVEKITEHTGLVYSNGYTVTLTDKADPTHLYFANRLNITSEGYNKQVKFTFRNAMAKVRVGMYETIPGYSVTIDGFEVAESNANPSFGNMSTPKTDTFAANLTNNVKGTKGTMIVEYSNATADKNRPIVNFKVDDNTKYGQNVLYLGENLKKDTKLGTSATNLVYDQQNGAYTDVYPMQDNTHNLKLSVNFTLKSTVGETIEVKHATAEVPAQYLQWKPGCAYTYIFKISDQTNGVLGSITGLHPITFEAVNIIDGTGEDELISTTTAANYNIITFGFNTTNNMVTVGKDDYNADDDIYAVVVTENSKKEVEAVTSQTATKLYEVTTTDDGQYPITEASVENYLKNYSSNTGLLDAPVTAIEASGVAEYVDKVPKGDETSSTNNINAMKWKAKQTVYAVEYTVPSSSSDTKYYKVVRVDGFGGKIEGQLKLSTTVVENNGGVLTPTLTINGEKIESSDVKYALDTTVPKTVTIESDNAIKVAGQTTAGTYKVIATYNRRTYTAEFTVKQ